jgi:hypothetical protein
MEGNGARRGAARAAGVVLLALGIMAAAGAGAWAQETASAQSSVPQKDIFDVLRELFHKPPNTTSKEAALAPGKLMFDWTPYITGNSANGIGPGVGGSVAFFQGDPKTTQISSAVWSLSVTSKGKIFLSLQATTFSKNNGWHIEGDNRLNLTSENTYGLGTSTLSSAGVNTKFDFFRLYDAAYRQVFKGFYLGAGFLFDDHTRIKPAEAGDLAWPDSPFVTYSEENGFSPTSQVSAGVSANALFDTRDSSIYPTRGWYASGNYHFFFKGFLGGASTWQEFVGDLRTYARLGGSDRHILAFWLYGDFVTGGTAPYFDLPTTGMDTYGRTGRGYSQGRFRGQEMAYGEIEYRWTITRNGLLGMVAFLNTETLSNKQTGERLFGSLAPGGGVGLRLLANKFSRTNICADVGWGKDGSFGFYLNVQEGF